MEQALTQLAVKIIFNDSTGFDEMMKDIIMIHSVYDLLK